MVEAYAVKFDEELVKIRAVKLEEMLELSLDFVDPLNPHGEPGHYSMGPSFMVDNATLLRCTPVLEPEEPTHKLRCSGFGRIRGWPWPSKKGKVHNEFCSWAKKMEKHHAGTWKKAGIFDLIQFLITDVTVDGDTKGVDSAKASEGQQRSHGACIKEKSNKDSKDLVQHIRFLALWPNRYIIYGDTNVVSLRIGCCSKRGVANRLRHLKNHCGRRTSPSSSADESDDVTAGKKASKRKQIDAGDKNLKCRKSSRLTIMKKPSASSSKNAFEMVEEEADSSPGQHVSSPPESTGKTPQKGPTQKTNVTAMIPAEEFQKCLSKPLEETEQVATPSCVPTQSIGVALMVLYGLYKIHAEYVHAPYHQELKEARNTILKSDLPGAEMGTVGIFLAGFEQRKVSCKICVKHVQDYNHLAMAYQEAEETAKILLAQVVGAAT
ncbi:OLC1v1005147C1 [Oldenlandia corymbosa var. corymbosa]|uniref:OLC1v1005147C1 n=1 Tax=Oldenlandia corymbosa var. corymbosa TaxID=529605 RepID=A0AAV1DGD8_OLDCO|nr:OLC1v1005147C1 [Oldenlandia corymbosa var. corymbosa]